MIHLGSCFVLISYFDAGPTGPFDPVGGAEAARDKVTGPDDLTGRMD